jgi:hypothetical protein
MQKRIEKINQYFNDFKVCDGLVFISVDFPKKWQIPSNELLEEMFKVKCVNKNDGSGHYFFSQIENGMYNVFDSVDFTIDFNLSLEEKSNLLQEKIEQLKSLFVELPIEVLRTIEFKYAVNQSKKSRKNTKKKDKIENIEIKSEVTGTTDNTTIVTNGINNENNSLLDFAQDLVNNEQ